MKLYMLWDMEGVSGLFTRAQRRVRDAGSECVTAVQREQPTWTDSTWYDRPDYWRQAAAMYWRHAQHLQARCGAIGSARRRSRRSREGRGGGSWGGRGARTVLSC